MRTANPPAAGVAEGGEGAEMPTPYADRIAAIARRLESLGRRAVASARRDGWGTTLTKASTRALRKARSRPHQTP